MSREDELEQMALEEIAQEELDQEQKAPVEAAPVEEVQLSDPMMGPSGGFDVPEQYQNPEADEAVRMGAVQGVPFGKDLYTSFQTMATTGFNDFGENKNKNQMEWEENFAKMEEKYPNHTNVGDLASSTLGFSALPAGMIPMTVYGAFSGASRAKTRELGDVASGAATGAAVSLALPLGLKGLGKAIKGTYKAGKASREWVGKQLGILSDEFTKIAVGGRSTSTLSKVNRHITKFSTPGISHRKQTREVINRIVNTKVDGQPLLGSPRGVPQSFKETSIKAQKALSDAGKNVGNVVKQIDGAGVEPVNGKVLENQLRTKLVKTGKILNKNDPAEREAMESAVNSYFSEPVITKTPQVLKVPSGILDASGNPVMSDTIQMVSAETYKPIEYTAKALQDLKLKVAGELKNTDWTKMTKELSSKKQLLKAVRDVADDAIEGMSSEAVKTAPELSGLYRKANTHYADMALVSDLTTKAGNEASNIFSMARAKLAVQGALARLPNTSGANKASAVALATALGSASASASTDKKAKASMAKVSEYVTNNPDSEFLKRIIVGATASDRIEDVGETPFIEAISSVNAEISLLESPIKRNLADIKLKSDLILEVLQYHSPVQANIFREALINNDEESMRALMDQASKINGISDSFEDGKGIDGRVFDPQDIETLTQEVEAMDIPLHKKLIHKKALKLQGIVPVIEQEVERFFKPEFRDKDKPKY
jgi:hypothetical protein